jgi:serine/threonine-protein kinase PknG
VQPRDPESLLRAEHDLVVAESRRRCPNRKCRAEVGRSQDGIPGQAEGRCPACGTPYSFRPQLRPGDILGQYKVRGCVGYGGQGWVYLARDLHLDDDPVALKGQRVAANPASQAAAAAERHTLIKLRHPDIVDIRNFVTHPDPVTGEQNGYIVLEFLAGESLEDKMIRAGRLPVAEAISYILAVLPALGYLHDNGLVYGDFKPANVMQVGNRIKLIDLGAVRRIGDTDEHLVLTPGFHAPEVGSGLSPSVSSDLYTVGRTLAVLTAPVERTTEWETGLPGPGKIPVFGKHESFYWFLCRATDPDPKRRFGSAAEMAGQLTGVLRETVAHGTGGPLPPLPSVYFTPERDVLTVGRRPDREAALALPVPRTDPTDPAAAFLGTVTATDPGEVMAQLRGAPRRSLEAEFRRTLATMRNPRSTDAEIKVDVPPGADPSDWRIEWYRSLRHLAVGDVAEAWLEFARIRDLLPGELAPKLALATCAERLGDSELARHYYQTVWRTGQEFVGAAFGIARTYAAEPGDDGTADAIETLESVPASLRHHVAARITAMRLRLSRPGLSEKDLREAAERLRDLDLAEEQHLRLQIEVWQAAREWLARGNTLVAGDQLLGASMTPDAIGFALERAYLSLRRYVSGRRERVALVKNAHAVRPRTRWRWSRAARAAEETR